MGPAAELVDSRNNFPSDQSEDFGESVGRVSSNSPTHVRAYPVPAFEIVTGSEYSRGAKMRLHEREGPGLDAADFVGRETQFPQLEVDASTPGFEPYTSSAPVKRQKQKLSVDAIDDLFDSCLTPDGDRTAAKDGLLMQGLD